MQVVWSKYEKYGHCSIFIDTPLFYLWEQYFFLYNQEDVLIKMTDCNSISDTCWGGLFREDVTASFSQFPFWSLQMVKCYYSVFCSFMEDNNPYLALLQCSIFSMTFDNKIFFIIPTLLKASRHNPHKHSVNWKFLFMQTFVFT